MAKSDVIQHGEAGFDSEAEAGLRGHETVENDRGGCFKSNRLSSSNSVPMAQGDGGMNWALVNHDGFHEGRIEPQNLSVVHSGNPKNDLNKHVGLE